VAKSSAVWVVVGDASGGGFKSALTFDQSACVSLMLFVMAFIQ